MATKQDYPGLLLFQCKAAKLPVPEREVRFHPTRKFQADLLFRKAGLIVECDGGLFINGGHSRGAAREKDYARDAEALMLGLRVLRVSPRQIKSGDALSWIEQLVKEAR